MADAMTWATRQDASGGTAHASGVWKIIDHKTGGINLYRSGELVSVGFRSVDAAKAYAAQSSDNRKTHA